MLYCGCRDHPRRCGENRLFFDFAQIHKGSPPQVRGKLHPRFPDICKGRITPAGAGKTLSDVDRDGNKKDHPRRCGENTESMEEIAVSLGSPPQVRGKRILNNACGMDDRITPAGAGKTKHFVFLLGVWEDHPRRCGENGVARAFQPVRKGSPPQVRGKLPYPTCFFVRVGITPAGAGKTEREKQLLQKNWDHPRRCGENTKKIL